MENKEIQLKGFKESWQNFFEVIRERKNPIERRDGESTGNFWAFIQHLEQQFKDIIAKESIIYLEMRGTHGNVKVQKEAIKGTGPLDFFLYEFRYDNNEKHSIKVISPCCYESFLNCNQWKSGHANCPIIIINANNIDFNNPINTWKLTVSLLKGENKQ